MSSLQISKEVGVANDRLVEKNSYEKVLQYELLQEVYDIANHSIFNDELPPRPLWKLQVKKGLCAHFKPKGTVDRSGNDVYEISFNPEYFGAGSLEVFQSMVHEMMHMYYYHKIGKLDHHNKIWREMMYQVGLKPVKVKNGYSDIIHHELSRNHFLEVYMNRVLPKKGDFIRVVALDSINNVNDDNGPNIKEPYRKYKTRKYNKRKTGYKCVCCGCTIYGKDGLVLYCSHDGVNYETVKIGG